MDIHIHIDDRLVTALKRLLGGRRGVLVAAAGVLVAAGALYATSATPPNTFVAGTTISSAAVNTQFQQLYGAVAALEASNAQALATATSLAAEVTTLQAPPGTIVAFGGVNVPAGWRLCDGSEVSRIGPFAPLFAAVGIAYGPGDGVTTFDLPDFRGMFLRGHDGGAGKDPDRATRTAVKPGAATGDNVGSVQGFDIENHKHPIYANSVSSGGGGPVQWGLASNNYDHGLSNLFPGAGGPFRPPSAGRLRSTPWSSP